MELNSDVEGEFTCKVTSPVYDTETGHHLLIPQGSTIGAKYTSNDLLYGNARLPTLSLSLTLRDGSTVDLGKSPLTDQLGTQGLTGRVDQHFWRLAGAVFIGGALRGGAQMAQIGTAQMGVVGAVPSGMAQSGGQAVQQRTGRTLDSRPTIHVEAGQLGIVLLTKPLALKAFPE